MVAQGTKTNLLGCMLWMIIHWSVLAGCSIGLSSSLLAQALPLGSLAEDSRQSPVSSSEFLSGLSPDAFLTTGESHHFPIAPFARPPLTNPVVESYRNDTKDEDAQKGSGSEPSVKADNRVMQVAQWYAANQATNSSPLAANGAIGSGVVAATQFQPVDATAPSRTTPFETSNSNASPRTNLSERSWFDWLNKDPARPDFFVAAEMLSFRRHNDSGGNVSDGTSLDRFGREVLGRYTLAKLDGEMQRSEFVFTGPFRLDRNSTFLGPVDASLPLDGGRLPSFGTFENADHHQAEQSVRFSSFELNRCWSGDGMSSFLSGFRLMDYREKYHLLAQKGTSSGSYELSTNNLMVGGQMGLRIVRPLSQRLSLGAAMVTAILGNFTDGSYRIDDDGVNVAGQNESDFRLNLLLQPSAQLNYRLTQNANVFVGYECMSFTGLATTADQRIVHPSSSNSWVLSSTDEVRLYGWLFGLSAKF